MKYPILYNSNETDFFAMGLGPVEMLKATVTQERNGIFIFEGEILIDNPLFPLVLENYIIKADADHLLKDQRFRIKRIVPNHDGKAQIYAEHVSYLSRELTIKPEVNITGSAQVALNQWKASIVESNPFVVSSDITTSASTKWRIDKVSNPMMALGGVEGSILDRWGGEYLFDNYHISLLKKRGKTATNILAYGRNITDFEQERNILSTYTSIAPYAIYTDDREREVIVTVDGYVVDSEHVNKFPNRVTKPIDFSSGFGSDEIPTKARLTTLAQQYIADNEIGVPTTSIKISFLDLSQTADYADYAFLEQVNLCDDVRVYYPKLGVNTIAKVVRVVWNCLTESYDEIEIGQKRMSLASQIQEQNKVIQEINTQTNHAQVSADGKNMIFYGLYGENGLGEPNAIKIGDSWFKPSGLETELYVWTGIEWKLIMSTSSFSEIEDTIETLDEELEQTTTTANDAVNKAEQAISDAGFATDIANQTADILVDVKATADNAKINADNAVLDAQNALNKAIKSSVIHYALSANGATPPPASDWQTSNPNPTADQYVWTRTTITLNDDSTIVSYSVGKIGSKGLKGDTGGQGIQGVPGVNAPTIKSVVQQYYLSTSKSTQTGGSWLSAVPVWSSGKYYWVRVVTTYSNGTATPSTPVLDNALNESLVTALEAKTANQNLSTTVTQHATLIEGKANSTTVDAIDGRVTNAEGSITAIAGQVALKANSTDVDILTGRVTSAEGNITTQAGLIELKAEQSVVDTLTGRVTATEASIEVTDGKVTTLTTKTDDHTTQIGTLETSYSGLSSTVTQIQNDTADIMNQFKDPLFKTVSHTGVGNAGWTTTAETNGRSWTNGTGSRSYFWFSSPTTVQLKSGREYQIKVYLSADTATDIDVGTADTSHKLKLRATPSPTWFVGTIKLSGSTQFSFWIDNGRTLKIRELYIYESSTGVTTNAFSTLEQSLSGFKTTVQDTYADKTTVTQLADQWTQTTELANGHTSQIASLGTDINLRVTKDDLIGEINLQAGRTIFRQSDNVMMITPTTTYIQNATIKTAHIADLAVSGAKIADATIGSAKIISLDASKITVGTLTGHTLNGAIINGGTITGTSFFNSGNDGDMSIANGRIRAKDFFVDAEGSLTSLTSYVVVRSNQSHVFLQPAEGHGVSVTKIRTAGGIGNFMPITASSFRGGNTNAVFEGLNGYTVVRSSGDSQPVYLQGNEIRATSVSSAGSYVAVRASAFPTGSLETLKTDVKKYTDSALQIIRDATIYDYKLKEDLKRGRVKTRIGLVIGHGYNTPNEIIDGDGVEQYAMNSLGWKAIQELDATQITMNFDIWQLKNEIKELKNEINSLRQAVA